MLATVILVLCFILWVVGICFTEIESFGWATIIMISTIGGLQYFNVVDVLHWAASHTFETCLWVGGYIIAGIVWSFIKWFSFLHQLKDAFLEAKRSYRESLGLSEDQVFTEAQLQNFYFDFNGNRFHGGSLKVRAANNKKRIVSWMGLWPFSVVGTILNDPVRRIFRFLFERFKATYQAMADWVFSGVEEFK